MAGAPKRQFSRETISLDPGVKKDWQEVKAQALVSGDTVRGCGTVEWIDWDDSGEIVTVTWKNGTQSLFAPYDVVTAFTAVN